MRTDDRTAAATERERPTLAAEYEKLAATVMPAGAGDVQRLESRRMFYAGATALFVMLYNAMDDDDEVTETNMTQLVARVDDELNAFALSVAAGDA